jgi:preprotein translocase subunit SecG
MFTFLLVVQALIAASLVGVILMQQSEGGGLGMGGSPTGLMSARGAADFLTRATTVLATLFVMLSIASAVVASRSGAPGTIDTSLKRATAPAPAPAPAVPVNGDPLATPGNNAVPAIPLPAPASPVPASTVPQPTAPVPASAPASPPKPRAATTTRVVNYPPGRVEQAAPNVDRPAVTPTVTPSIPRPAAPATSAPVGPPGNAN